MKSDPQRLTTQCEISGEDLRSHERFTRAQRISWIVMAGLLVAALAGLLGRGPLSRAEAVVPASGLHLRYDRFVRYQAETRLEFTVSAPDTSDNAFRLHLSREFYESMEVTRIDPTPRQDIVDGRGHTLVFDTGPGGPAVLRIACQPRAYGRLAYDLRVGNGPALRLRQFVFP